MVGKRIKAGLYLSIGLHLMMVMIPVTMRVAQESDEIEFYITDEKPEAPSVSTRPMPPASEKKRVVNQMVIEQREKVIEKHQEETSKLIQSSIVAETLVPPPKEIFEEPSESQAIPLSSTLERSSAVHSSAREEEIRSQTSSWKQPLSSSNEVAFGSEEGPRFLRREMPIYPMMARKLGREGRVMLKLSIDEKGNLSDVEVIDKAGYGFTEAAVEAVKKSTFLPARKNGKPIASRALLPIRFQLERN